LLYLVPLQLQFSENPSDIHSGTFYLRGHRILGCHAGQGTLRPFPSKPGPALIADISTTRLICNGQTVRTTDVRDVSRCSKAGAVIRGSEAVTTDCIDCA
jgi:hypothetical protein